MVWISFRFLNLTGGVTGGLIENIEDAIGVISGLLGTGGVILEILFGMIIGVALIFLFPIHWALFYRPDDISLLMAITIPWILCYVITSGLFVHSPRQGIHISLAIGIGYAIILTVVYLVLAIAFPIGSALLDGVLLGLTDLPYLVAVLTAILEGSIVGAIFGAFIGALKYKPKGVKGKKIKSKVKDESPEVSDLFPTENNQENIGLTTTLNTCYNCGARLTTVDMFCTNCGAKRS